MIETFPKSFKIQNHTSAENDQIAKWKKPLSYIRGKENSLRWARQPENISKTFEFFSGEKLRDIRNGLLLFSSKETKHMFLRLDIDLS